jgi:F-type H+-transporting ATPase subunit b
METFFYLATEEVSGGFGLNLDILGSNLINLAIVVGLLIFYGGKFVGNILTERRAKIEEEITEAETRASEAAAAVAQAQKDLTQAKTKAGQIKAEAEVTAQRVSAEILAQGDKEIERMKAAAGQELDGERAKVIAELKRTIAVLAIEKAQGQLKESLNEEMQGRLISRAVGQLGG